MTDPAAPLVTFDLFSALVDSRSGGTAALAATVAARGWDVDPARLYDTWDAANKASQRDGAGGTTDEWTSFAGHSARAMAAAQEALGLAGDPDADAAALLATVGDWPLWPDVAEHLPTFAARYRVGVLSNVDDAVFARTRVAPLVDDAAVLTSERLHAYKPAPELYRRARERAGGRLVHVATSARDVAGALAAGIATVRLRRPGHALDPAGPVPEHEVGGLAELGPVLARLTGRA